MLDKSAGLNTKADGTRRLFSFTKLEDAMLARFEIFCKSEYQVENLKYEDLLPLLLKVFSEYDKVSDNAHDKATLALSLKQTPESMSHYFKICDDAIAHAYKTGMVKKLGLKFGDLDIWDAMSSDSSKNTQAPSQY